MIVALAFITSYVRRAANEGLKNSDSLIISIHTLRTEDGHQHRRDVVAHLHISIHALHAEGDSKSSQNIAYFCSTSTKMCPADITIHVLYNYVKSFSCRCLYFLQNFPVRRLQSFSVFFIFAPNHYNSSTSSCAHCGQRPICSTLFLYEFPRQ